MKKKGRKGGMFSCGGRERGALAGTVSGGKDVTMGPIQLASGGITHRYRIGKDNITVGYIPMGEGECNEPPNDGCIGSIYNGKGKHTGYIYGNNIGLLGMKGIQEGEELMDEECQEQIGIPIPLTGKTSKGLVGAGWGIGGCKILGIGLGKYSSAVKSARDFGRVDTPHYTFDCDDEGNVSVIDKDTDEVVDIVESDDLLDVVEDDLLDDEVSERVTTNKLSLGMVKPRSTWRKFRRGKFNHTEEIMTNDKLSKLKQSGYMEENVYTIKYMFGKPDIEGKLLQYRITYDKGNNNIIYDICDDSDICNPMIYGNKKVLLKYNAMNLLIEEKLYSSYDREDGEDGCRKIIEYNDKGLIVKESQYDIRSDLGGCPDWMETYKYDDEGKLLLKEEYCRNWNDKFEKNQVLEYNKGLVIKKTSFCSSEEIDCVVLYEYNDKNLLVEEIFYDEMGELTDKNKYVYDDRGLCINKIYLPSNRRHERFYDDKGSVVMEAWYNSEGTVEEKHLCKYNDKQLLIQKAEYDYSDERGLYLRSKCEYEYNDRDLITKIIHYDSLECPIEMIVYEYK